MKINTQNRGVQAFSNRQRENEEFIEMKKQSRSLSKTKNKPNVFKNYTVELAASFAHGLRNPLTFDQNAPLFSKSPKFTGIPN